MAMMSKLGKYEIKRELGKGAMGVVYEGFDPVIQRTVAIKTILPAQLKGTEAADILARFKREAQAAGRLNHPGIVAVYDYGEETISDDEIRKAAKLVATCRNIVRLVLDAHDGGIGLDDLDDTTIRDLLVEHNELSKSGDEDGPYDSDD